MTYYELLVECFRDSIGTIFSTAEISRIVEEKIRTRVGQPIKTGQPSDFCYNRWNVGLERMAWQPLFIQIGRGEYRYEGSDFRYRGLVYARSRKNSEDVIVGDWSDGQPHLNGLRLATIEHHIHTAEVSDTQSIVLKRERLKLSKVQIELLYEKYLEVLTIEVGEFRCAPTETRHLIGRLGEFYCARRTGGLLATRVNQSGFDVIGSDGRKISVKTTAQTSGFVSISSKTLDRLDDLMVLQYRAGDLHRLYYGDIRFALENVRQAKGTNAFELDLSKAREREAARRLANLPPPD